MLLLLLSWHINLVLPNNSSSIMCWSSAWIFQVRLFKELLCNQGWLSKWRKILSVEAWIFSLVKYKRMARWLLGNVLEPVTCQLPQRSRLFCPFFITSSSICWVSNSKILVEKAILESLLPWKSLYLLWLLFCIDKGRRSTLKKKWWKSGRRMALIFVFLIVSLCSMYHKEESLSICVEMGENKKSTTLETPKTGFRSPCSH